MLSRILPWGPREIVLVPLEEVKGFRGGTTGLDGGWAKPIFLLICGFRQVPSCSKQEFNNFTDRHFPVIYFELFKEFYRRNVEFICK